MAQVFAWMRHVRHGGMLRSCLHDRDAGLLPSAKHDHFVTKDRRRTGSTDAFRRCAARGFSRGPPASSTIALSSETSWAEAYDLL